MPGSSLSWSSVAELRSTKPDFGVLEASDFDFDCDVVELAVACVLVIATDKVRIQAKTNRIARIDGFLGMVAALSYRNVDSNRNRLMVLRSLEGVNTRITGRWRRGLYRERRLVGSRSWGMEEWHGLTSRSLRTEVDERWNSLKRRQDRRTPHLVAGVGVDGARAFHRFGQAAADRAECEGRDIALWS